MEKTVNQSQDEPCVTHGIRLTPDETSDRLVCPVCVQMNNQEQLRRRSRRR